MLIFYFRVPQVPLFCDWTSAFKCSVSLSQERAFCPLELENTGQDLTGPGHLLIGQYFSVPLLYSEKAY